MHTLFRSISGPYVAIFEGISGKIAHFTPVYNAWNAEDDICMLNIVQKVTLFLLLVTIVERHDTRVSFVTKSKEK